MADSRLADIYRKELKTKGLLGALVSASGARLKEKTDIRGMLPQTGVSGAAFEKMFGKRYKYGGDKEAVRSAGGSDGAATKSMEEKLTRIGVDSKLTAKNTVVLPAMARDMNLMRMNMQKMVKLSGGTPSTKADMFFKRAGDREAQYEGQYKKNSGGLAPTPVGEKKEGGGFFDMIKGFLGMGIGPLIESILSGLFKAGLLVTILNGIGKYFTDDAFKQSVNKAFDSFFTTVFGEDYKKQLAAGAAILVGAVVAMKIAMAGLEAAMFAAARRMSMLGGGPGLPGAPGGAPGKMGILGKVAVGSILAWGAAEGYVALKNWNWGKGNKLSDKEKKEFSDKTAAELKEKTGVDPTAEEVQQAVEQKLSNQQVTSQKEDMAVRGTAQVVATVATGAVAVQGISRQVTQTAAKALEVATKPNSVWGKFLEFVAKKSPRLFASIGYKLAGAGLAATVPGPGWIMAAIELGMAAWTAYELYDLWKEFNSLPTVEENIKTPTVVDNSYDANGNFTGVSPSPATSTTTPAAAPKVTPAAAPKVTPGGAGKRGGTSPTAVAGGNGGDSNRNQIEAYLGKAISDAEYDALLRVTGAEAASNPMERAAVASVILNRAKKAGGDIMGVLNAPFQFQAVTGPNGKSGTTDNPHSANAKKVIPGIDKQIADNIALVPKGLDSFTSAVPSAYKDVGGDSKFKKKMAEMQAHNGTQIGQSMFASMGGTVQVASSPSSGSTLTQAQSTLSTLAMNNSSGGQTIVNAPTNNSVIGGGSGGGNGNMNPYNGDIMKYLLRPVA